MTAAPGAVGIVCDDANVARRITWTVPDPLPPHMVGLDVVIYDDACNALARAPIAAGGVDVHVPAGTPQIRWALSRGGTP